MIVDTSAILAVFLKEPGYEAVLDALANAETAGIGAPTLAETAIVLEARFGDEASGSIGPRFKRWARVSLRPPGVFIVTGVPLPRTLCCGTS